jgi:hypothetical protein
MSGVKGKSGPKCKVSEEVQDWCFEKKVEGWPLWKIAEELFKGADGFRRLDGSRIENEDSPGQRVHDSTVMRWIARAADRLAKEKMYRQTVQRVLHARQLESLSEFYHRMLADGELDDDVKHKFDFGKMQLAILKQMSDLLDVSLVRQRAEVKHTGVFDPKALDPEESEGMRKLRERAAEEDRRLKSL